MKANKSRGIPLSSACWNLCSKSRAYSQQLALLDSGHIGLDAIWTLRGILTFHSPVSRYFLRSPDRCDFWNSHHTPRAGHRTPHAGHTFYSGRKGSYLSEPISSPETRRFVDSRYGWGIAQKGVERYGSGIADRVSEQISSANTRFSADSGNTVAGSIAAKDNGFQYREAARGAQGN